MALTDIILDTIEFFYRDRRFSSLYFSLNTTYIGILFKFTICTISWEGWSKSASISYVDESQLCER